MVTLNMHTKEFMEFTWFQKGIIRVMTKNYSNVHIMFPLYIAYKFVSWKRQTYFEARPNIQTLFPSSNHLRTKEL